VKDSLRKKLLASPEVIPYSRDPRAASLITCLGNQQEVGTPNDELARFLFTPESDRPIPRESLRAELISPGSAFGVRIWAEGFSHLEIRFPKLRGLLHPDYSFHPDGSLKQLVVFPAPIARWLEGQGVTAVLVKPWALNTIFGGFHPSQGYYQTNMWEMFNIDVIRYAGLVERRQVPFLGTHDLVAHVAGTQRAAWDELAPLGGRVRRHLQEYFQGVARPNPGSLILPYIAGIVLDDLAQPPCYGAPSRRHVLEEVLRLIDRSRLDPSPERVLLRFPERYEKLVNLARFGALEDILRKTRSLTEGLVEEILATSVRTHYNATA
jgi:hypothetical protein